MCACIRAYTQLWDGHLESQKNPDQLKRSIHVDRIGVHSTFVYIYACVYVFVHLCVYTRVYVYVYAYLCSVCVYVHVYMYVCVYVCIYIYSRARVGVHMHSCRRILFICTVQSL